jgi:hypothetical protein
MELVDFNETALETKISKTQETKKTSTRRSRSKTRKEVNVADELPATE